MNRHIREFLSLNCASDLLALKVFSRNSAAKEITESMAAFSAVQRIVMPRTGISYSDTDVNVFVVGDGFMPRTGALFAMRTRWNVVSIDPNMRPFTGGVKRLTTMRSRIEDAHLDFPQGILNTMALIVLVHSHATIKVCLEAIRFPERYVVAIPCCVPLDIPNKTYYGYTDTAIWSPKNQVKVWLNV